MHTTIKIIFALLLCTAWPSALPAQESRSSELFIALQRADSALFNAGFNNCDIVQFDSLVSEHFEFYHDEAGITHSKAAFIAGIRDGLCKLPYRARRVLNDTSLQVFPLKKGDVLYGAIQEGIHTFYAVEKDGSQHITSIARFTHVWLLEGGKWRLGIGLSYDHRK